MKYSRLKSFLEPSPALERILDDINCPNKLNVTHLQSWQFFVGWLQIQDTVAWLSGSLVLPATCDSKDYQLHSYNTLSKIAIHAAIIEKIVTNK
jgi:hypothetical protein